MKNKTWRGYLLAAILTCSLCQIPLASTAQAAGIAIEVDGQALTLDVPPRLENGRTLVPLRACAEALNAQVTYDETSRQIVVRQGDTTITLTLDSAQADINGQQVLLDVPARTVNDRTLVPLRFVGESLNAQVEWLSGEQLVRINTNGTSSSGDGLVDLGEITGDRSQEEQLLALCNELRQSNNLAPLVWVEELSNMSRSHCKDMGLNGFFGHRSPSFGDTTQRAKIFGLPSTAENIATGYQTAEEAFQAWLANAEQSANILNPDAAFFGCGVWQSDGGEWYVAAEFINTPSFLVQPRVAETSSSMLTVRGYSTLETVPVTLYTLLPDDSSHYSAKQDFSVAPSNYEFRLSFSLSTAGRYALAAGEDIVTIVRK